MSDRQVLLLVPTLIIGLSLFMLFKPLIYRVDAHIRHCILRRRMLKAGQNPDRKLTRQERRHLEQRLAKQQDRAVRSDMNAFRRAHRDCGTYSVVPPKPARFQAPAPVAPPHRKYT